MHAAAIAREAVDQQWCSQRNQQEDTRVCAGSRVDGGLGIEHRESQKRLGLRARALSCKVCDVGVDLLGQLWAHAAGTGRELRVELVEVDRESWFRV